MGKKLYFEAYGGVGIRFKYISTLYKEYNPNTDYILRSVDPKANDFGQSDEADGSSFIYPNVTVGVRIAFAFKHKG
jgi:hypothetical protein